MRIPHIIVPHANLIVTLTIINVLNAIQIAKRVNYALIIVHPAMNPIFYTIIPVYHAILFAKRVLMKVVTALLV